MAQYSKGSWIFATSAVQANDGGFLLVGEVKDSANADSGILLVKTDSNGIEQWSKIYAGSGDETPTGIAAITENNYIIAGYTRSFHSSNEISVIKTDN